MREIGIFIAGVMVTLVVMAALTMLVWAAIQDGRIQHDFEQDQMNRVDEAQPTEGAPVPGGVVPSSQQLRA